MKKFLFLFAMLALALQTNAQVAANTEWTYIGRMKELPSSVWDSIPSVPKQLDADLAYINLTFDATTYDNNNQAVAFMALGNAVKSTVSPTYLKTTMNIDTSDISNVRLSIMSIQRTWDNINLRDKINILKQAEDVFLLRVRVETLHE